jgi:hypothetical protein
LALFFRATPVLGPKTPKIGFVWRGADIAGPWFWALAFWVCFGLRASVSGFASVARSRPIGFVFHATLIFGPKTAEIGFVWRIGPRDVASPGPVIALPQIINDP